MDPEKITYFAETDSRNKRVKFGIKAKDRTKHMYVIGKTGMGKSTLLENLAIQDIQNGEGLAFIDPHGGTAEKLLDYVPEERIKDVVYFAPFDVDFPISFNVMEDIGVDKRHLVVNGLMSAFTKLFGEESFSDRMQYILQNTILALLEYPGATMLGINKMLVDKGYRDKVIENITDPSVKTYWTKEYAGYTERFAAEAIPAIQNKIGQFTSNPLVRNLIGQPQSTFNIRQLMDEKKILIVNLSKGKVGEGNANLIGSMLVTKIYLASMSRADSSPRELESLPNFYLYVDEFQSFANKSFADILSEARKYKLNLTIAHQYIEQMEEEVRDAVFGNAGTMITFRVGAFDAEVLEKEFAPTFTAEDLVNLGKYQIYLKLMIDGASSPPFSAVAMAPIEELPRSYRPEIIDSSRMQFARPRTAVEEAIKKWHEETGPVGLPERRGPSAGQGVGKANSQGGFREERQKKKAVEQEKKALFEQIIAEEKEATVPKPTPVSLSALERSAPKKNKGPSSSHVSELRQVLDQLTKKETSASPTPQQKPQSTPLPKQKVEEKPKQETPREKPRSNEIPEDELRKLLRVDGEV